jgi:predicted nucleic acid-binding Zn ribbon protein
MNARMRARVIAEWRGLPEEAFPKDTSKPIGTVLTQVLTALGLESRVKEEEILSAWKSIAGDFLAQHSAPQRLVEGVLYVRVLQPSMHFELERTWRSEILKKLKQRFGRSIRDLRFRIG